MTGIEVSLELAILLSAGALAAGVWAGGLITSQRSGSRTVPASDALGAFLRTEGSSKTIDLAARRSASRERAQAVLHGRIDQFPEILHLAARDDVRAHVATVMRTGLRRGDRFTIDSGVLEGDGFTITIPGADERAAVRIAERLRRTLAALPMPQLGHDRPLSASFGVAAQRSGDDNGAIVRRARRALDAAAARGTGHVVPASEIEEIKLLPPPSPSAAPTASAA